MACRVTRAAMARKDFTYEELAHALAEFGVMETDRNLVLRLTRGRIRFTLFLQILHATRNRTPALWEAALGIDGTWEERARAVIGAETSRLAGITFNELSRRLAAIGVKVGDRTLGTHLLAGTFSLSLFLQCVTVLGSDSLWRFVEFEDLAAAGRVSFELQTAGHPAETV
jgi:hypothetical protein